MAFIIKRDGLFYSKFHPSGQEHEWTKDATAAWRFTFRSVPQRAVDNDPRLAGSVVEEV